MGAYATWGLIDVDYGIPAIKKGTEFKNLNLGSLSLLFKVMRSSKPESTNQVSLTRSLARLLRMLTFFK